MNGIAAIPQVTHAPPESWLDIKPFEPTLVRTTEQVRDGVRHWLSDTQINLIGAEQKWFTRNVTEVAVAEGLAQAASISTDFEPTYQRLQIHHLRLIRNGVTREIDPMLLVQTLRREVDLERAKFNGRLTAHITVPDVRVGDIIDYAYSLLGENPAIKGVFDGLFRLQWTVWVARTRVRILAAAERGLKTFAWLGSPEPVRTVTDDVEEILWDRFDIAPAEPESFMPAEHRWVDTARATDPLTWAQVADLFRANYARPDELPADLLEAIQEIKATNSSDQSRTARALNLVQDSLRYCAISIGDGGVVPRKIDQIWATRSGDCKDASYLLAVCLQEMGISATPCLVNTALGEAIQDDAPSAWAFDHCICRVEIGEKVYWLDGTRRQPGCNLETVFQPNFGAALPLCADSGLVPTGEQTTELEFEVEDAFHLGPTPTSPSRYESKTTFRSWRAEMARQEVAANGLKSLRQGFVEDLARRFGQVDAADSSHYVDDPSENVFCVFETFTLPSAWRFNEAKTAVRFETIDRIIAPNLPQRASSVRRSPIAIGHPRKHTSRTHVFLPSNIKASTWDLAHTAPGVEATSRLIVESSRVFCLELGFSNTLDQISVSDSEAFFTMIEQAVHGSGLFVNIGLIGGRLPGVPGSLPAGATLEEYQGSEAVDERIAETPPDMNFSLANSSLARVTAGNSRSGHPQVHTRRVGSMPSDSQGSGGGKKKWRPSYLDHPHLLWHILGSILAIGAVVQILTVGH